MVSCWSVDGKNKPTSTFTNNVQHGSTITVLKWNPAGKRLVTGDKVRLFFKKLYRIVYTIATQSSTTIVNYFQFIYCSFTSPPSI